MNIWNRIRLKGSLKEAIRSKEREINTLSNPSSQEAFAYLVKAERELESLLE